MMEEVAKRTLCCGPRALNPTVPECVGSTCMAWRWFAAPTGIGKPFPDKMLLDEVDLSTRSRQACAALGLTTVGDLRRTPDETILRCPNIGRLTLAELRTVPQGVTHYVREGYCGLAGKPE